MQLSKAELKANEKLIKILEQEFNFKIVADHVVKEGSYDEHIKLYQIYTPKKSNARGAGRKKTGKQQAICNCALDNPHYSITEIADYFGCSRQYVSRVLKENKVREKKRPI
jgi:AraC-like DNA-binding protein